MNEAINVLNAYAKEILPNDLTEVYVPFSGNYEHRIQIEIDNGEPFSLRRPESGQNTICNTSTATEGTIAVVRVAFEYVESDRMAESKHLFQYKIYNTVNMVLASLVKRYGDLTNKTVTCLLPGTKYEYFRELSDSAGFELRFVAKDRKNNK